MAFKKNKQIKVESKIEKKEEPIEIPVPKEEIKVKGYKLKKDFTKQYKVGSIMSEDKYNELKSRGIDIDSLVE